MTGLGEGIPQEDQAEALMPFCDLLLEAHSVASVIGSGPNGFKGRGHRTHLDGGNVSVTL